MKIERVELNRVTKRFGATVALRDVSATFDGGRVSLIVGANGSGKSTLLGLLGTTVRPTTGSVVYHPFEEGDVAVRAEIGWLSHESLSYPDLSGRKNLELAAELHGLDPRAVWNVVRERFQLGTFAERPLRTNSRGQKQRVALARALLHQPSVVLLDEPTTGLDASGVAVLLEVVAEVAQSALVIVVAHDRQNFERLQPRVWEMERGVLRRAA
jgi:heme exporter protein A